MIRKTSWNTLQVLGSGPVKKTGQRCSILKYSFTANHSNPDNRLIFGKIIEFQIPGPATHRGEPVVDRPVAILTMKNIAEICCEYPPACSG